MDSKESEFLKRIQATFRVEAEEHILAFTEGLIGLEKNRSKEDSAGIVEMLFREIHSLKGAARSVGQKEIESVCQPLESLISTIKKEGTNLTVTMFDLFHRIMKLLSDLLLTGESEKPPELKQDLNEILNQLRHIPTETKQAIVSEVLTVEQTIGQKEIQPEMSKETIQKTEMSKPIKPVIPDVVRIPISKLDPLFRQAEELVHIKMAFSQQTSNLTEVLEEVADWQADWFNWKRQHTNLSAEQLNDWFAQNELRLNNLENNLSKVTRFMESERFGLERLVNDHLESIKKVLMLPVSSIVEVFPAMVRAISREQKKEIDFIVEGSELEVDKRILEELKDPLVHLVRNCIDHGIGTPKERSLQNKPSVGKIKLSFSARENALFEIRISDDGNGIDRNKVLKTAIKSEIISPETAEKLGNEEILSLIFESGLSTSPMITDLSGRGLGLSIVKEKVEKLNGKLLVESKEHVGTDFRILLPMTLAAFRGIAISLGESLFILPTLNVERVLRIDDGTIKTVENQKTVLIEGEIVSLVDLASLLGLSKVRDDFHGSNPSSSHNTDYQQVVEIVSGQSRIAFKVDDVLDEQQVMVKGLGKLLKRVRNISGVTVMGNGTIVPVLHVGDLMKSAVRSFERSTNLSQELKSVQKSGKILVAEDSITSRTMLKNILETAGYRVTTAVDGADAYTKARFEEFDLIVSDVDMPRLNGFELTMKIKNDKKLNEIPVVLVTSLESDDDRERGMEAGADAYIVKSRFDQGNLLEIIGKLI
jgi:two-component system chemotaxis sensor kinase CheA